MVERNTGMPAEQRIEVRIGINLGDVLIEGEDRHGEGVNIAARLQELAEPGGICVSAKVREEVGRKVDIGFEDFGEQQLKNITMPVHVYVVRPGPFPSAATQAACRRDKPSISSAAVRKHERRPEQEFRRRHCRRDHHRTVALSPTRL
jgi:class 3 adenylate cyclase